MKNLYALVILACRKPVLVANNRSISYRHIFFFSAFLSLSLLTNLSQAQCPSGTQRATLDWDYKDYFTYSGNYSAGYLPNLAAAQIQNFTFGTQRLTISTNYAAASILGEVVNHTAETGTYGTGMDVRFNGNGQITLTFENDVQNLQFTVHDIEDNQRLEIDAYDASSVAQNVTFSTFAGTEMSLSNNGATNARAQANNNSNEAYTSLQASVNVDIAGPVRTLTLRIENTDGNTEFFISDISACSAGTFPSIYYDVSAPFPGQPGYVLHSFDKSVYAVDPATGANKLLFTDPYTAGAASSSNRWFINSMAYDPYNRFLYYVFSLTSSPSTNTMLRKYDFNTETISTVLADVRTIGVPLTTFAGVESGAAAFYNGSLYLGIETSNSSRNSSREAIVWRIDFNGSNVPYRSSQAFALPVDNGSSLLHDWSDFAVTNGILYDFDGAGASGSTQLDLYEHNLMTGATLNFTDPTFVPGQVAVDWNENVYQVYASNPTPGYIAQYNKTLGTIGTQFTIPPTTGTIPSLGDAGEAFRPLMDFGDAPATYDPVAGDPAVHERLANLHLGNNIDIEWLGSHSFMADSDGADEDAITMPLPDLYDGTINYSVNVNVLNNTGANATLIGWLDYNHNGVFEASEGVSVTVPSLGTVQSVAVNWNSITVPATANSFTFLRVRLAPSGEMTTADMSGYIPNGEVEDYPINMSVVLPSNNLHLKALKNNYSTVDLSWDFESNDRVSHFTIQKSNDGIHWSAIGNVPGSLNTYSQYSFNDPVKLNGTQFYRLAIHFANANIKYSAHLAMSANYSEHSLKVTPNPARNNTMITISSVVNCEAQVILYDYSGKAVIQRRYQVSKGSNLYSVEGLEKLEAGVYIIKIQTPLKTESTRLVITR